MAKDWKEKINDLKCGVCNFPLILYEIQAKREITFFKAKCPAHGIGTIKIPTGEVSKLIPQITDQIFRCFTCGGPATVDQMVDKEVWKLLKVKCPIHGISKKYKINYHVFSEVWAYKQKGVSAIKPTEKKVPIKETKKIEEPAKEKLKAEREEIQFCRECGVKLKPDYLFCNKCGVKIIKLPIKKDKPKEQNYCGECGYPTDHKYKFCIRCGTKL
ncbi:MAG: zinc ribbon domain-containing protein [Promethearchaeota archaeon]